MSITHHKSPETSAGKSRTVDVGFIACFSSAFSSKVVGHIELPVMTLFLFTELRSCVKVEVAVLGSPSLIVPTVDELMLNVLRCHLTY